MKVIRGVFLALVAGICWGCLSYNWDKLEETQ